MPTSRKWQPPHRVRTTMWVVSVLVANTVFLLRTVLTAPARSLAMTVLLVDVLRGGDSLSAKAVQVVSAVFEWRTPDGERARRDETSDSAAGEPP